MITLRAALMSLQNQNPHHRFIDDKLCDVVSKVAGVAQW